MKSKKYILLLAVISLFHITACNTEKKHAENSHISVKNDSLYWYQKPMRIAAMQCNFDNEDHLAVIDKWVEMGFNVEQLLHTIGEGYTAAIYNPDEDNEVLTKYLEKAHRKGLKVILYLNIHFLDPKVVDKKEEWSQRKKDGSISKMYGTYYSNCLNSPWKEYFFSILDSLKKTDIDGIFLDGPVITNGGCYCNRCMVKYHEMFNGKPGSEKEKRWEFNAITRDDFLQDVYDYYKKDNPDKVLYMNLSITSTQQQYIRLEHALKYNDIVGTEGGFMFYGPAKNAYLWRPSFTAKLIEAVAPKKPRVIFMAADHKPWSWWMHSALETKLCISSVIANSANIWWGMHGSSKLFNTDATKAAGEVLSFYKANEDYLLQTKSDANVALFYSFSTVSNDIIDFNEGVSDKKLGNQEDALRGYYSMLTELQIPFDIITDFKISAKKLAKYKVLVIPNTYVINQEMEAAVRGFVKSGGLLIIESGTSLYNKNGKIKKDFGLADVLGVSVSGNYKQHENYNYFIFEPKIKYNKNISTTFIPLPLLTLEVKPNHRTKIIAKALKDLHGRYTPLTKPSDVMITINKYVSGNALFIAGNFGEMYNEYHVQEYKEFIKNVITEKLVNDIEFENAPVNLEVVLRNQDKRKILHLINYQGGPTRPFEKVTTITNLRIKVPKSWNITKAISKKLNTELNSTKTNKFTEFILPKMNEYELLVLEKK